MSKVLLMMAVLAADSAREVSPLVAEGVHLYKRGRYSEAVKVLERALATTVTEVTQRSYARSYLAACYDAQNDAASAAKTFKAMIEEDPDATIDASRFSPDLVALFEKVKRETPVPVRPKVETPDSNAQQLAAVPQVTVPIEPAAPAQWQVRVRSQLELGPPAPGLHGAVAVTGGLRLSSGITLEAGPLVSGTFGAIARAGWSGSFNRIRPSAALEIPVVFTGPLSAGVGASAGVGYDVTPWLTFGAEVPVYWLFAAPEWATKRFYAFGALTVAARY
jgi:hypothetical protein